MSSAENPGSERVFSYPTARTRNSAGHATHQPQPAIFFDCDGVLNEEPGLNGVLRAADVLLTPTAAHAVKAANAAGHFAVAVTNRPQVARGDITFRDLDEILGRLENLLAEHGAMLDRIYFCPHHPDAGVAGEVSDLKIRCKCRKPGSLMIDWACADLPIDLTKACLVGDSLRDIGAAHGAGIWGYGVRTGHGCRDVERYAAGNAPRPDLMFADVGEAAAFATAYGEIAKPAMSALAALDPIEDRPLVVAIAGHACAGKSTLAHALTRCLDDHGVSALHVADGESLDPAGCAVVILDGGVAPDPTARKAIDLAIILDTPNDVRLKRFQDFHRWQDVPRDGIDRLWQEQCAKAQSIDAQRASADLVLSGVARTSHE